MAGVFFLHQNLLRDPFVQFPFCTRVNVVFGGIVRKGLALLYRNQVVRAGGVIALLHSQSDFVVGLSKHLVQLHLICVVA